jgi:putative addiction module component (TIGR02574 family)
LIWYDLIGAIMSQSSLPPEIRQLSLDERVQLVEQIWESIAEDEKQFHLTDAQKAELDRRLAALQSDPSRGSSWDEVKARLLGK